MAPNFFFVKGGIFSKGKNQQKSASKKNFSVV